MLSIVKEASFSLLEIIERTESFLMNVKITSEMLSVTELIKEGASSTFLKFQSRAGLFFHLL